MVNLPYISTATDAADRLAVTIRDTEVFDYIEDFLTQNHDLDYLWLAPSEPGAPASHTMVFPKEVSKQVEDALLLLDQTELHRLYLLNNQKERE